MAIVTALQFSASSGAMICDEEYWFLRRRRSFFLDNIRRLIPADISESLGMEAAYGGWGHPGFHEEVIRRTHNKIRKIVNEGPDKSKGESDISDIEDIALLVRQAMQETRRRKIDDMLKYLYGFNVDELNQGYWEENGSRYDIKQDAVLNSAKGIVTFQSKSQTSHIFQNKAVVVGYDPKFKYRGFHINAENTVCSLISGGFEAIGAGFYGAGVEFSRIMNRLTLDQRRKGFDRVWGTIALIEATLKAYDHFHEVGGGLNMIYINGDAASLTERYVEIADAYMQLAKELVKAYQYQLITQDTLYPLMRDLIFNRVDPKTIEHQLFQATSDSLKLRKLLRGYKFQPYPESPDHLAESTSESEGVRS